MGHFLILLERQTKDRLIARTLTRHAFALKTTAFYGRPFFFVMRRSVKVGKNVYVCDIYSTNDGGLLWTTVSFTSLLDEQNACRVSSRTTSRNLLNAALIVDA